MKKFFSLFLITSLILTSIFIFSKSNVSAQKNYQEREVITDRQYIENFAEERGLDESEITQIEFVYYEENDSKKVINDITPKIWGDLYVRGTGQSGMCGVKSLWTTSGWGPGPITQSRSHSIASSFSANIGISAKIVSAGIGFNVSKNYTVTDTKTLPLEKGEYGEIISYPLYRIHMFSIYKSVPGNDKIVGKGSANEPSGVCFVTRIK